MELDLTLFPEEQLDRSFITISDYLNFNNESIYWILSDHIFEIRNMSVH